MGYIGKTYLDKKSVENILLMENDDRFDEYYALKVCDNVYHIYGIKVPKFIIKIDNYDLARVIEKE